LNFIRGRSLHNSYIICDEAQNANKLLIRDVITRAGHGSKIIVAGDPTQCDVPTLDKKNNGLVFAADRMKGNKLCAIISFEAEHCVRSPLAEEASKLLI
jgi:PhoH-like ATPase